jgi:hypothetical protein
MHDEAQIESDPGGPEILVLRFHDAFQLKAGACRIHLKIERGGLDGFLLFARKASEAVDEGIGDPEFYHAYFPDAQTTSALHFSIALSF